MSRRLCDICHARPAISLLTLHRGELHREIEVCEFHAAGTAPSKEKDTMNEASAKLRREYPLETPTDLGSEATNDLAPALTSLLADFFALYLKTKNFHWHMSGPHFRDYHLLLDDQGDQILAATDDIAERVRKIGGTTLRSIGEISTLQRIADNDADFVTPLNMLSELREDNMSLTGFLRELHSLCDKHGDVATASLIEIWIDEAERRSWFLYEAIQRDDGIRAPRGA